MTNDPNGRPLNRRVSRTDLDFEQALRTEGTVVLKEGIDVDTLGVTGSPASVNRSYSFSQYHTPISTPVNRSISRVTLQPPTPIVVPPSPSPAINVSSSQMPGCNSSMNNGGGSRGASMTLGPAVISKAAVSSLSSSQELGGDTTTTTSTSDEAAAERIQTNRRSMYRSPGTSSSPDLATLLKKAKERGGSSATMVGALGRKEKRREEPPPLPDLPYHHTLHHGPVSYTMGDSNPSSPNKNKDGMGTFKVSHLTASSITSLTFELPGENFCESEDERFFWQNAGSVYCQRAFGMSFV